MLAQLLNEGFVSECLTFTEAELGRTIASRRRRGAPSPLDDFSSDELREVQEALRASLDDLRAAPAVVADGVIPKDDFAFMPRDPLASIVQSVIDEHVDEHAPEAVEAQPPAKNRRSSGPPLVTGRQLRDVPLDTPEGNRRRWRPFEVGRPKILSDPRWLLSGVVIGWHKFKRKAQFVEPRATVDVADRARVLLVGDWGSGLPRAQDVAERMREHILAGVRDGRQLHVIHLGDVYYTGGEKEYQERFLRHWPVDHGTDIQSYTLMGNHDMYRGGHAFYGTALADDRFAAQEGSSVFALSHPNWLLLGLDTSYEDKALHGGQLDWIRDQMRDRGERRTALLSHHQLYSAYEPGAEPLGRQIEPVLNTGDVTAWFWAHEHRCLVYEHDDRGLEFASCVGHGGIPEYLIETGDTPYPPPLTYDYRRVEGDGREPFNTFGFAVVDLNGRHLDVRYIDEHGTEHHRAQVA